MGRARRRRDRHRGRARLGRGPGRHRAGDVLLAVNGAPVETPADVVEYQHASDAGTRLAYTLVRLGARQALDVSLAPLATPRTMYFVLAAVGLFTLLVGASVRLRRPRDQATLHFFWLCVAFFGAFTFSFNGPFDRLDWVFYWGDAVAMALLPPLLLHFTLVFPERPPWRVDRGRARCWLPLMYLPALVLGAARVVAIAARIRRRWRAVLARARRARSRRAGLPVPLRASRRVAVLVRAFREITSLTGAAAAALDRLGHRARRRAVRLRLRAAVGARRQSAAGAAADRGAARPGAADVRVGDRALPPARRRGHHQARRSPIRRFSAPASRCTWRCSSWSASCSPNERRPAQLDRRAAGDDRRRAAGAAGQGGGAERARSRVLSRSLRLPPRAGRVRARPEQRPRRRPAQSAAGRAHRRDAGRRSDGADAGRRAARRLSRRSATSGSPSRCRACSRDVVVHGAARRAATPSRSTIRLPRRDSPPRKSSSGATRASTTSCPAFSKAWRSPCWRSAARRPTSRSTARISALLTAVAGQVATAIENGRLYRQLHLKAEELGRMREFNENILESLDDGLVVFDADERIVRWNRALEDFYGVHARRGDRPIARRRLRRAVRRGAAARPAGSIRRAPRSSRCRCSAGSPRRRPRTSPPARQRHRRAAAEAWPVPARSSGRFC